MKSDPFTWEISESPYPSPFLTAPLIFDGENPIFVIDQYRGRQPTLLNKEFLTSGKLVIPMTTGVLLDSQTISSLERYVNNQHVDPEMEALLHFITEKGWDISGNFYLLEHYAKADWASFEKYATQRILALLHILSMDEPTYLETKKITPNPEAVDHYLATFQVNTLEDAAASLIAGTRSRFSRDNLRSQVEFSEIAIIKMILIHRFEAPTASVSEKLQIFRSFLRNQLDVTLAREEILALHYFCDLAGRLIGVQTNTRADKALNYVSSTAWDLFLIRFPEFFFEGTNTELYIPYIATREKKLAELASLMTLERIHYFGTGSILPIVGYSMELVPDDVLEEFNDIRNEIEPVEFFQDRKNLYHQAYLKQ